MKRIIRFLLPLAAALSLAACNSGGLSTLPGSTLQSTTGTAQSERAIPEWQARGLAKAVCPAIPGKMTCTALLISKSGSSTSIAGWTPADIETRYNLPSSTAGAGEIVAIVDADDNPNIASDLNTYRAQFGLGTAKFTKYNQTGQTSGFPSGSQGWGLEEDLDVQMVSATCPKCTIYLVEANSRNTSDLEAAEATAVKLGAHIISNSWICYASSCGASQSSFDTPGVVYLAASGDMAYRHNGPPSWFSSVVSVGGTVLSKSGSNYSETVWRDAGGGCSNNGSGVGQPKPSWQHDPSCAYRTDADVAAVAWNVAEYDSYGYGGWTTVGGTSVATPINAGVFALAGNAGSVNAGENFWKLKVHKQKKYLHYISSGSNGSCNGSYLCTAGTDQFKTYAGPIGWGTPNGIKAY